MYFVPSPFQLAPQGFQHPDGRFGVYPPQVDPRTVGGRQDFKTAGGCGQNWASFPKYAGGPGKTAGGVGLVIGGVLVALLVGLGITAVYAIYLGDKFEKALPQGCALLAPDATPNQGWVITDPQVALPAAMAIWGNQATASRFIQAMAESGIRIQCPPGAGPTSVML